MKFLLLLHSVLIVFVLASCKEPSVENKPDPANEVKIPLKIPADDDFVSLSPELEYMLIKSNIDSNKISDGKIRYSSVKNVDSLDLAFAGIRKSLKGLEYFTNLKYLKVRGSVSTASGNPNVYYYAFPVGVLNSYIPSIDTLDVSNNLNLEYLDCSGNSDGGGYWSSIGNLKLGDNSKLKTIISYSSMISSLDLSGLINLETLDVSACYNLISLRLCDTKGLVKLKSGQLKTIYVPSLNLINPKWEIGSAVLVQCK